MQGVVNPKHTWAVTSLYGTISKYCTSVHANLATLYIIRTPQTNSKRFMQEVMDLWKKVLRIANMM